MYTCGRDLQFRLKGTIVWYKGKHRYVRDTMFINTRKQVLLLDDNTEVQLGDADLKISSIPCGYFNLGGTPAYLVRKANRTYRQGLRSDNVYFYNHPLFAFGEYVDRIRNGRTEPPLRANCKILSKDFAVIGDELHYRGSCVGVYVNDEAYTNNENFFLKELLEEVLDEA